MPWPTKGGSASSAIAASDFVSRRTTPRRRSSLFPARTRPWLASRTAPADGVAFPVGAPPLPVPGERDCRTVGDFAADGRRDEGGVDDDAEGEGLPLHGEPAPASPSRLATVPGLSGSGGDLFEEGYEDGRTVLPAVAGAGTPPAGGGAAVGDPVPRSGAGARILTTEACVKSVTGAGHCRRGRQGQRWSQRQCPVKVEALPCELDRALVLV